MSVNWENVTTGYLTGHLFNSLKFKTNTANEPSLILYLVNCIVFRSLYMLFQYAELILITLAFGDHWYRPFGCTCKYGYLTW